MPGLIRLGIHAVNYFEIGSNHQADYLVHRLSNILEVVMKLPHLKVCCIREYVCGVVLITLAACTGQGSDTASQAPTPTPSSSFLSDAAIHAPPTTGMYAYNTFQPGAHGFPVVGGTYTDPVFGGIVKRLTNIGSNQNNEDIYAHHWANANGTYVFSRQGAVADNFKILSTMTGDEIHVNQPYGSSPADLAWDPIDPDKYYYFDGADLVERSVSRQMSTPIHRFGGTLESLGGSLDWIDRTGDLFVVKWGGPPNGTAKVWRKSTNSLYSGEVPPLDRDGWVAITPDGNYLVTAAGESAPPNIEHYSYQINHAAKTIGTTPTQFWGLCGDHGDLISASDGGNYFVTFACANSVGVYRVDITKDQAGRSESQQLADNLLLIDLLSGAQDGHFSAVSKGLLRDWVFIDTESFDGDEFDFVPNGWVPYKQEILAVNVLTGEIRRFAHHRSRGLSSSYYAQPRISSSWDGSIMLWTSNYNVSSPIGYADLYSLKFAGN
ncbi:MAG: hypothetical protein A4E19_13580 [Nitrospira sp. SG-bin1]|nr:MAG: hypothetical protein A4E19_13580 [Nitrospira sp. SG-bin1]